MTLCAPVMAKDNDATLILAQLADGDQSAAQRLLPLVYGELRALAGSYFRGQPADHTLQPTALVHEAYVRLINTPESGWNNSAHFFAVAATAMRQILMDSARRRRAAKRGGGAAGAGQRISLDAAEPLAEGGGGLGVGAEVAREIDLVALDDALTKLERLDERKHRVVELRFFGGLTMDQIAEVMDVSKTTVESDWRAARAWLAMELER